MLEKQIWADPDGGVSVAVLDTGITPHIDFDNRILVFLDLIFGHAQPYDDNGHGFPCGRTDRRQRKSQQRQVRGNGAGVAAS